jgi:hypothetical protein
MDGPPVKFPKRRSKRGPESRLRAWTLTILVAGFGSVVAVYFTAAPEGDNPLGYNPLDTKGYVHDMELYGGKANVLAEELREWFVGLWQGRQLAYTIAVLTVIAVLIMRSVVRRRARSAPGA